MENFIGRGSELGMEHSTNYKDDGLAARLKEDIEKRKMEAPKNRIPKERKIVVDAKDDIALLLEKIEKGEVK